MNQTVALRQLAARVITRNKVTALTASRLQQRFPTALQRAHFANASSSVLVSETRTSEKVHRK